MVGCFRAGVHRIFDGACLLSLSLLFLVPRPRASAHNQVGILGAELQRNQRVGGNVRGAGRASVKAGGGQPRAGIPVCTGRGYTAAITCKPHLLIHDTLLRNRSCWPLHDGAGERR